MTPAQRAILSKAKKDGLKPSEIASEFLLHDLVEACLTQMRKISVAFKNLGEKEQDAAIAEMTDRLKEATTEAVRLIMAAGTSAIPFKLKSLTIDGKLKVTGHVEGDHPERHALTDKAHDKSEILLILSPRDYFEGVETIKGERDQKSLPLEPELSTDKPAKREAKPDSKKTAAAGKPSNVADIASKIVFAPDQLQKAVTFITEHRKPNTAGLQNLLGIGFQKAEAMLAELARQGLIHAEDDGTYSMPPLDWSPTNKEQIDSDEGVADAASLQDGEQPADEPAPAKKETAAAKKKREAAEDKAAKEAEQDQDKDLEPEPASGPKKLTDELYELMKAKTIKDQKVSAGGLAVAFDTEIPVADEAIDRMEMEGVISDEDEVGQREVFDLPE